MWKTISLASVAVLFCCLQALPQSNASSGEIKGTITDASGAVVPGATVTVTNTDTGFSRTAIADERGEYRILLLPPGAYEVRVELSGFAAQVRTAQVTVGQTLAIDFRLQVGTSAQTITVSGEPPVVETERVTQSNTIEENYIRNLPIDRRDYLSFTLLAPGVVDSNALADNTDFRVAQTPQSGLSFYGSNGRGNSVTVDGAEANDAGGGVRSTLSQEAVQEFQINRSNYAAEFGGASGGVINIVSKSGSNSFHGRAFGFFRHDKLDAGDPFAIELVGTTPQRIKPPSQRQQYGGTLGFPLRKDRTFFFGGFEGLNRDESSAVPVLTDLSIFQPTTAQTAILSALASNTSTAPIACLPAVPTAAMLPPAVCATVLRGALTSKQSTVDLFRANSGVFPFTTNSKAFSVRIDHIAGASNQLFLRYNYSNIDEGNQSTRALLGFSRSNNVHGLDSNAVAGWTHIFSSSLVNEARFQWNYRKANVRPNDPNGPEFNITGFGFFNRDIFLPSFNTERRYEAADNLILSRGKHRFKFGAVVLTRGGEFESHTFFGGRFGFGTLPGALVSPALGAAPITALQAFDLGLPQSYQTGFGDPTVASTEPFVAFYGQDSWNLRPNLTLNYGLRYELDDRRDPLPTDKNNFAPRFGFAWDPWNNKRTVVRGGFGIFYSPIYYQIDYVVDALNEIDGFRQIAQVLTTLNPANPLAVNGPINIFQTLRAQGVIGVPQTTRTITAADLAQFGIIVSQTGPRPPLTVLFRPDPDYRNAYSQQASLGLEHEFASGFSTAANYIFASTLKITRARDINVLPRPVGPLGISDWTAASGCAGAGITACFRDPLLFQENVYESSARAFYHGMIVEISKRFHGNVSLSGSYTFSKAIDEVTDYNSDFQPNDQTNVRLERALSAFDQRHKFVIYAFLQSPYRSGSGNSALSNVLADFVLTPIFRANSTRPFNLLVGGELNGDRHSTTDRPVFAGRNTGIGPNFWTLDLRLGRRIGLGSESRNLELIFEAFNLFNRLNFASVNNTVGPSFPAPYRVKARKDVGPSVALGYTSAFDPRRIQLGFRLSF
jgi:Carboxypeptidase regulatory-like domain/TonB dependent receptor